MSHFTTLVIGDNIEQQLQPFHEFECTGINDEYIKNVDITKEFINNGTDDKTGKFDLKEALSWYGFEDEVVINESDVNTNGVHKYGYAVVRDGKVIKVINRTNPNKKWDWWLLGGRWAGFFRIKNDGYASSAKKGDIDFDAMRNKAEEKAAALYDKAHSLIKDKTDGYLTWEKMRDEVYREDINAAREAYRKQPAVKALRSDCEVPFRASVDDFLCPRDEYIQNARNSAISTFAVIKDGKWYKRGDMGWWGMVSDEKEQGAWELEFSKLLDSVSDDTTISVVDCHI